MPSGRLTDELIRAALPYERPYKLADGGGLYIFVAPTGSKLWRLKYRFRKAEKVLSFGPYPKVSLAMAPRERAAAKPTARPCRPALGCAVGHEAEAPAALGIVRRLGDTRRMQPYVIITRRITVLGGQLAGIPQDPSKDLRTWTPCLLRAGRQAGRSAQEHQAVAHRRDAGRGRLLGLWRLFPAG